jgi:dTMP kinase
MKKGKFITISGGEGSGKSTLLERLKKEYPQAVFTYEPGGSEFGIEIRKIMLGPLGKTASPLSQMHATFSGSADHLAKVVLPALENGRHVFSDRICRVCSFAYQIYGDGGQDLHDLFDLSRKKNIAIAPSDLAIIVDIDPEEGMKRVAKRKAEAGVLNHYDARGLDFHKRIRQGYLEFA